MTTLYLLYSAVQKTSGLPGNIDFFCQTTGPYLGFAKSEEKGGLLSFLDKLESAGSLGTVAGSLVAIKLGPKSPKVPTSPQRPQEAILLVHVRDGSANKVLNEASDLAEVNGAAVVSGAYDLVIVVTAATLGGLAPATRKVRNLAGVHSLDQLIIIPGTNKIPT